MGKIGESKPYNIIVILDYNNMTYSVIPKNEKQIEKVTVETSPIVQNKNNKFNKITVTDEQMALNYYNSFTNDIRTDLEELYDKLDPECIDERFTEYEVFENYIKEKKESILTSKMIKWQIIREDDYVQYICADNKDRYYVFYETAPMQYTVMLGTYFKDFPQFIEAYEDANIQERVLLNIDKIKQAINYADYDYIYSKLADSFKNNKFKTKEEFENYMRENLYSEVVIEYKEFKNEADTYIYNIAIKNLNNKQDPEINMEIIMQLKEETDFIFAFSIK